MTAIDARHEAPPRFFCGAAGARRRSDPGAAAAPCAAPDAPPFGRGAHGRRDPSAHSDQRPGTFRRPTRSPRRPARRELDPWPLARILLARGRVAEDPLLQALSTVHGAPVLSLHDGPPDPRLAHVESRGTSRSVAEAVPWRSDGDNVVVATARPPTFFEMLAEQAEDGKPAQARARPPGRTFSTRRHGAWGACLAREAETRAAGSGCRAAHGGRSGSSRSHWPPRRRFWSSRACFRGKFVLWAFALAGLSFTANIMLKAGAFAADCSCGPTSPPARRALRPTSRRICCRPPVVSILCRCSSEPEIANVWSRHLSRMRYPPERLDVLLLLEADDTVTAKAIAATSLPPFMRVLTVPRGKPRTKPRALNYALPFARGEIVGIYDAEDRPDPNQIAHVVRRYDEVPRDVACLQGAARLLQHRPQPHGATVYHRIRVMVPRPAAGCAAPRAFSCRWAARRCFCAAMRWRRSAAGTRIT